MKEVTLFRPNDEMHKAFGDALRAADKAGVKIIAMDCSIEPDSIEIDKEVKVVL
jgi:sugar fermentation stimulation protein A